MLRKNKLKVPDELTPLCFHPLGAGADQNLGPALGGVGNGGAVQLGRANPHSPWLERASARSYSASSVGLLSAKKLSIGNILLATLHQESGKQGL